MGNNGVWSGGKGSSRRPGKINNEQHIAKVLGCTWCDNYLMIKKKCMLKQGEKCPQKT